MTSESELLCEACRSVPADTDSAEVTHSEQISNKFEEAIATRRVNNPKLIQVAPMLDVTDRDFRYFTRLVSKHTELWTEMVSAEAIVHSSENEEKLSGLLEFDDIEHPIVLQLGSNKPEYLKRAAEISRSNYGYSEINLNAGCPSCKVAGAGEFGAALMKNASLLKDCLNALSVGGTASLKTRLGVDSLDSDTYFASVIDTAGEEISRLTGKLDLSVHCRIALLNGISPAQNRSIPPLNYPRAFRVLKERPAIKWTLNGGVTSLAQAEDLLVEGGENMIGVMIGRAVQNNPVILWDADRRIYGKERNPETVSSRRMLLEAYCEYLHDRYNKDGFHGEGKSSIFASTGSVFTALKPVMGVFSGMPGNKKWRNSIDLLARDVTLRTEGGPAAVLEACIKETDGSVFDEPIDKNQK